MVIDILNSSVELLKQELLDQYDHVIERNFPSGYSKIDCYNLDDEGNMIWKDSVSYYFTEELELIVY